MASEASPQTDEVYPYPEQLWIPGRCEWTPAEPQGHALNYGSLTLGGSEDPWTTGARDEDSTIRGGRVA